MNLLDRIKSLALPTRPAIQKKSLVASIQPAWNSYTPTYAIGAKFESLVKSGYRKNELIFACIARRAVTGAQIKLILTAADGKTRIDNHPMLEFMRKPNPNLSEAEFWATVIQYQQLAGRAIYEIERSNGGQPIALWPLRPDYITVEISKKRPVIEWYKYTIPGSPAVYLKPANVLDFPLNDPLDQHTSFPPVAVAARVGDVDNDITDFIKLLIEHGGMPMGLLKTVQALTDDEAAAIRSRWNQVYGGFENWVRNIAVLDRDASYERTGLNMQELGFEALDARDEVRICQVLDVPPILVGAKVGLDKATYSNYETALKAWWQNSIIPMYNLFLDTLNSQLAPQFGAEGYLLDWDVSKVPVLQQNMKELAAWVGPIFNAGGLTVAEMHMLLNLPMPEGTDGKYYLRPSSVTMIPLAEADTKPEPPPELGAGGSDDDMPMDKDKMPKAAEIMAEIKLLRATAERLIDGQPDEPTA